ncbi:His Kinase A (phospho-acceptor) domain-containing protein [Paenibacillus barengoltzii]|jgi:signal transduction histidine kinase|nr:His Kinase A (phospho-acceptor) domain-containing protein [Paenibacillus barengoltzii]
MTSFTYHQLKTVSGIPASTELLYFLPHIGTQLATMFCHKPIPVPSLIKKDAFQDVRLHILTLPKIEIRRKTCSHPKIYKFYNVEHRRLNAAFAHDLRTPLTVLRGYADFLCQYVPEGKVGQEKLLATLSSISRHTLRLESYAHTMSETNKLEDVAIRAEKIRVSDLTGQINSAAEALKAQSAVEISIVNRISAEYVCADAQVVLRVVENLLSNALRFAHERVEIGLCLEGPHLITEVADDGDGFTTEALREAARPYFREEAVEPGRVHFGLGLYICQTLCERHGGQLVWCNEEQGGARVTAKFLCTTES